MEEGGGYLTQHVYLCCRPSLARVCDLSVLLIHKCECFNAECENACIPGQGSKYSPGH